MRPGRSARFAPAAASFRSPKARMISSGMVSLPAPMGKFCTLRCVCAPQYRFAYTGISPMESCSSLYSIVLSSCDHYTAIT